MPTGVMIRRLSYVASALIFIFCFILFYNDSKETISSLFAALLTALLTLVSFIMIGWLIQVFTKRD